MERDNNLIGVLVASYASEFTAASARQSFIDDWYFARAFVTSSAMMAMMCRVNEKGTITAPLSLTLEGTSSRMCAVLRELILRAHYMDFDERSGANASTITILYEGREDDTRKALLRTPFLGNYLHYLWEESLDYLDIRVLLVRRTHGRKADVTEEMLGEFTVDYARYIDTCMAEYANRIYCLGSDLYNLPAIDTANAGMYELPLQVFETDNYEYNRDKNWENNSIKDKLSNVFCTDTFLLREMMLRRGMHREGVREKSLVESVKKNILPLSRSEHSRWVAEKLIMGFRPWTSQEHYHYDRLFGDAKQHYYSTLKKAEAHYNICSYQDLSRLEPQNMRYDTFLILTMLAIIKKTGLS